VDDQHRAVAQLNGKSIASAGAVVRFAQTGQRPNHLPGETTTMQYDAATLSAGHASTSVAV